MQLPRLVSRWRSLPASEVVCWGAVLACALVSWYLGALWLRLRRAPAPDRETAGEESAQAQPARVGQAYAQFLLSLVFSVPGLGFLGLFLYVVLFLGGRLASVNEWGSLLLFCYLGIGSSVVSYGSFRRGRLLLRTTPTP